MKNTRTTPRHLLVCLVALSLPFYGCDEAAVSATGDADNPVRVNDCNFDGSVQCPGSDLSGAKISGFDLTKADLAGADLPPCEVGR